MADRTRWRGAATAASSVTIRKRKTTTTVLRNLVFPNGICMTHGQAVDPLRRDAGRAASSRYWFDGPKEGKVETVIDNLPGYPDNINRASDGNYWLACVGMRTPAFDLALRNARLPPPDGDAARQVTNGSIPTSTPAASSNSTRRAKSSMRCGIWAATIIR